MSAGNPGFAAVEPGRPTVPLSPPQVIWADLGSEKKRHQRLTEVAKKEAFSVVCLLSLRSLSQACPVGDALQRWGDNPQCLCGTAISGAQTAAA